MSTKQHVDALFYLSPDNRHLKYPIKASGSSHRRFVLSDDNITLFMHEP